MRFHALSAVHLPMLGGCRGDLHVGVLNCRHACTIAWHAWHGLSVHVVLQ